MYIFTPASFLLQLLVPHTLSLRVGTQDSLLTVQGDRKLKLFASVYGRKFVMNAA
jgi:hypothetical protein